jgi:elongation factor Ts
LGDFNIFIYNIDMIEQKKLIELVKKMRIELGLGMMEIKAALEESDGDEKKAKEILKSKGLKKAESKKERETHQGRVATYTHATGKVGAMVELLCETDFVAKNEEFIAVGRELCLQVVAMDPESNEELLKQEYIKDASKTIDVLVKELVAKFGENIKVGRFQRFEI